MGHNRTELEVWRPPARRLLPHFHSDSPFQKAASQAPWSASLSSLRVFSMMHECSPVRSFWKTQISNCTKNPFCQQSVTANRQEYRMTGSVIPQAFPSSPARRDTLAFAFSHGLLISYTSASKDHVVLRLPSRHHGNGAEMLRSSERDFCSGPMEGSHLLTSSRF